MAQDQVYIQNLPEGTDDSLVQAVFGAYGTIKWSKALASKKGGAPAALVQFASTVDAQWFVDNLNGNIPEGLAEPIEVKFSLPPGTIKGKKGDGKGKGDFGKANGGFGGKDAGKGNGFSPYDDGKGGKDGKGQGKSGMKQAIKGAIKGGIIPWGERSEEQTLFIRNLPADCTDRDLYELCSPFGAIPPGGVKTMMKDGVCGGTGFVDFCDIASTLLCIQGLNGLEMPGGAPLQLSQKTPGKGKGKGKF